MARGEVFSCGRNGYGGDSRREKCRGDVLAEIGDPGTVRVAYDAGNRARVGRIGSVELDGVRATAMVNSSWRPKVSLVFRALGGP